MKCLFTKTLVIPKSLPSQLKDLKFIDFPEKNMSIIEQRNFNPKDYDNYDYVITNCPFIVSCFRAVNVVIFDNDEYTSPNCETYGSCFEVLSKTLNGFTSMLPQLVVDDIKIQLEKDKEIALEYITNIGDSMDKAYLLRKLDPNY
jgi:hypothetical protein